MLGRTANDIFWMFRYLERAENTARLLEAGHRIALTRGGDAASEEWKSVITTLGLRHAVSRRSQSDYTGAHVCDFVLRGKGNPDSVLAMFETRAHQRPAVPHGDHRRSVGSGQRGLDDLARAARAAGARKQPRHCAGGDPPRIHAGARRDARLDAAQRDLQLRPAGHLHRAGRQHRAHPRHEILRAAAVDLLRRHRARQRTVGECAAVAFGRAGLSLAQCRADGRALDRRFPDPRRPVSRAAWRSATASLRENLAALACCTATMETAHALVCAGIPRNSTTSRVDEIFDQGLHEFLLEFIATNRQIAEAIAQEYPVYRLSRTDPCASPFVIPPATASKGRSCTACSACG